MRAYLEFFTVRTFLLLNEAKVWHRPDSPIFWQTEFQQAMFGQSEFQQLLLLAIIIIELAILAISILVIGHLAINVN